MRILGDIHTNLSREIRKKADYFKLNPVGFLRFILRGSVLATLKEMNWTDKVMFLLLQVFELTEIIDVQKIRVSMMLSSCV
jgi:hypothetical protein